MAAMAVACACGFNAVSHGGSASGRREAFANDCVAQSQFWGEQRKTKIVSFSRLQKRVLERKVFPKLDIEMAISRQKKEATVEKARKELEGAFLVAGINYGGLTVQQLQTLRKNLPESSTLIVAKNKLIGKAVEGTKWEVLKPALKGMNAWLFVHTEEVPAALKPYRDLQKELKLENNDFTGAVFEGKFFSPEEFQLLESMPTRAEIYSKLLGTIQSPAASLISTLQGPARQLVFTMKAYVAKLEEESSAQS